jgi:hypothetical protein
VRASQIAEVEENKKSASRPETGEIRLFWFLKEAPLV